MLLREYWLNRASLFCAVVGILLLAAYSFLEAPKQLSIAEISEKYLDAKVRVRGVVSFSKVTDKIAIFMIDDGAKIKGVFFRPGIEEKIMLRKGSFVEVVGKVKLYRNKLEIVAEKVNLLD
jgi:RecJ-like exonuclease